MKPPMQWSGEVIWSAIAYMNVNLVRWNPESLYSLSLSTIIICSLPSDGGFSASIVCMPHSIDLYLVSAVLLYTAKWFVTLAPEIKI